MTRKETLAVGFYIACWIGVLGLIASDHGWFLHRHHVGPLLFASVGTFTHCGNVVGGKLVDGICPGQRDAAQAIRDAGVRMRPCEVEQTPGGGTYTHDCIWWSPDDQKILRAGGIIK